MIEQPGATVQPSAPPADAGANGWKRALKTALKAIVTGVMLAAAFPLALLSGFGRIETVFQFFAQSVALAPGKPGDYLRTAYYFMTLRQCSLVARISFGSFFAHSSAVVGKDVYIGAYCILGRCNIGDGSQLASHVQILSGAHQHRREADGRISGASAGEFVPVSIGPDCWLGASAVVMADVGARSTVGAGSVVPRPVPADVVVAGNPAQIIKRLGD